MDFIAIVHWVGCITGGGGGGGHVSEQDIHSERQSTVTFKIDSRGIGFTSG